MRRAAIAYRPPIAYEPRPRGGEAAEQLDFMMKIGVPLEQQPGEHRVAASPETVKKLLAAGVEVIVEHGAGHGSAISDDAFRKAGAVLEDHATVWDAPLILKVQRPTDDEMARLQQGQMLVGALDPFPHHEQVKEYAAKGVTAFALELLPRTTRAQAMDILSSQANLAGYKLVVDAVAAYSRCMPMMMTAAGTVTPAKFFVVGAGVAGLQAIATAKRMGAVVTATDVRPAARQEIESLAAKFVGFIPEDGATSGGYARPLTPEEQKQQAEMVAKHLETQDIVVTTALIPGRKAPRIITAEMVKAMKAGAVVMDLAAESGGNVDGSEPGETITTVNGVTIIGAKNLPSKLAPASSLLYAKNLMNFVMLLVDKETKSFKVDEADDLVKGTLITKDGSVVHPSLQNV
jgi:H+-translocating NAD(P) transhydrogenase subunit alpha